jgi:hypothetical protein
LDQRDNTQVGVKEIQIEWPYCDTVHIELHNKLELAPNYIFHPFLRFIDPGCL